MAPLRKQRVYGRGKGISWDAGQGATEMSRKPATRKATAALDEAVAYFSINRQRAVVPCEPVRTALDEMYAYYT